MTKNLHKSPDWTAKYKLKLADIDEPPYKISDMKDIDNINDFKHIDIREDIDPEFDIKVEVKLFPYIVYVNDKNHKATLRSKSSLSGRDSPFTLEQEIHEVKVEKIQKGSSRRYSFVEINGFKYPIWSNLLSKGTKIELKLDDKDLISKLTGIGADNTIDIDGWQSIGSLKQDLQDAKILKEVE